MGKTQRACDHPQSMKVTRHGKPSKLFTDRLRAPTSDDYERMVHVCVEALVRGSQDVLALFPYTLKFPEDFPRGILEVKYEDGSNVHRIKAKKLLAWLRERGHTDITTEDLRRQAIVLGLQMVKIEEMMEDF